MITSDPTLDPRRKAKERVIWLSDIVVYTVLVGNGIMIVFFTSDFINERVRWEWAILVWGVSMILAGLLGFAGRLLRYWTIEMPGAVLAMVSAVLYGAVIGSAVSTGSSLVLMGFVVIAFCKLVHRYIELRILVSEPGVEPFAERLVKMLKLRTDLTVEREYY